MNQKQLIRWGGHGWILSCAATAAIMGAGQTANALILDNGSTTNFTLGNNYQSTLYTSVNVRFTNHRRDDEQLNVENSWLPHVLAAQQAEAGFSINPEALKALAVADRSLLYYSLDAKPWISSGHGGPECDLTLTPSKNIKIASAQTEREYIQFNNAPIVGYAVSGAKPSNRFVTENFELTGKAVQRTTIGSPTSKANRGCFSIAGADELADKGWNYADILKFYFGADAQLALGTYKYQHQITPGNLGGASSASTIPAPAKVKVLANFEHDSSLLSAGPIIRGKASLQTTAKAFDSKGAQQINIDYDEKHAMNAPFSFRMLSGVGPGGKGVEQGNMILPSAGEMAVMLRTTTPGLSSQILVNDKSDGAVEKSATRELIADGHWHLYSWQVNSSRGWKPFEKGKGDGRVSGAFTLNSILLNGGSDATVSLDDVLFNEYPNTPGAVTHITYTGSSTLSGSSATSVKTGSGTLWLNGNNTYTGGAISVNAGTLTIGSFAGGNIDYTGASIGTFNFVGGISTIPALNTGTITLANSGSLSTILGGLSNYALGPGTQLSHLENGVMLLSGGTFGTGGLLIMNSGTLLLMDASVAPQFAILGQSSGIVGTVLAPEPACLGTLVLGAALVRRRRTP